MLPQEVKKMASNEIITVEAHFKTWREQRFPNPPKGFNAFEYYCVELFTRHFDISDPQVKNGIVGGGQNGGVDGFFVFANGEVIDAETELTPKEVPEIRVLVMQVKSDEGFSPVALDKLHWFLDDLLDLSRKKAEYHTAYNDDLIAAMRLFKDKFQVVVGETPPLFVDCVYIIKKDVDPNEDCIRSAEAIKKKIREHFQHAVPEVRFIGGSGIYKQLETRPPNKKRLKWSAQPMPTQEGEVGLVKIEDYFEFVKEPDGKIAERFFDSNVRGYWPTATVNKAIVKTLEDPSKNPEFWLLNNGITILAEKVDAAGYLEMDIHDPQIVNGLQTSRSIYNYFNRPSPPDGANRRVLVRIIKTTDKNVRDAVIRCTNSQNEMPEEALRTTDPIHRQLETLFGTNNLFYDRRKGHYREQRKPADRIISVVEVLQAMVSIVLKRPDDARGRPRDYFKKTDSYKTVFGVDVYPLTMYFKTAQIARKVGEFLDNKVLESIHRRNVNFYLCMYAACVKSGNAYAVPSEILKVDPETLTEPFLEDCFGRVWKQYERLAEKHKVNGERDYDSLAKGPLLLKALDSELKRRLKKK
jgi:hypothetical protein